MISKIKDNYKLLDCKGEWFGADEKEVLNKYNKQLMVGFLADSHHNVFGFMSRESMIGYYCSHYRELTSTEVHELTCYD